MRPTNVSRFEWSAYLSLVTGTLSMPFIPERAAMVARYGLIGGSVLVAVCMGMASVPIMLIARRRQNWARWSVCGLTVVGMPSFLWRLGPIYRISPTAAALEALSAFFALASVWFIFTGDAADWFKQPAKICKCVTTDIRHCYSLNYSHPTLKVCVSPSMVWSTI